VFDALWDHHRLPRPERDRPLAKVHEQFSFDDIEKLVVVIVFMPMVLTTHDADSHD
jgi:hypothetical protein